MLVFGFRWKIAGAVQQIETIFKAVYALRNSLNEERGDLEATNLYENAY